MLGNGRILTKLSRKYGPRKEAMDLCTRNLRSWTPGVICLAGMGKGFSGPVVAIEVLGNWTQASVYSGSSVSSNGLERVSSPLQMIVTIERSLQEVRLMRMQRIRK